jgi:hypothetical protein
MLIKADRHRRTHYGATATGYLHLAHPHMPQPEAVEAPSAAGSATSAPEPLQTAPASSDQG